MAEVSSSDYNSSFASSSPIPFSDDSDGESAQLGVPQSDASSVLTDTDAEEGHEDAEDEISLDGGEIEADEEEEEEEEDDFGTHDEDSEEEDSDAEEEEEEEEDNNNGDGWGYDNEAFDDLDFDIDMRDAPFDFDRFDFLGELERAGPDDGFPDDPYDDANDGDFDGNFDVLHQAFLHELEHHLAQEPWAMDPESPPANQPQPQPQHYAGAGRRSGRIPRDELVQVEVNAAADQGDADRAAARADARARAMGDINAPARSGQRRQPYPDVIDLTGDDDVDMPAHPSAASQPPRSVPSSGRSENQRRLRSQPQNAPPRLNRSDGSYIDGQPVIVLSSSEDEDGPIRAALRRAAHNNHSRSRRNHGSHHHHHHHHHHHPPHPHLHPHPHPHPNHNMAARPSRQSRFGDQSRQPSTVPGQAQAQAQPQAPAPAPAPAADAAQAQFANINFAAHLRRPFSQLMQAIPFFTYLNDFPGGMANRNQNPDEDLVITGERNIGLPDLPINLDYAGPHLPRIQLQPPAGVALATGGPPRPAHVPPTPARPGFTRDTGEDVVAICPSCEEELAYDPEEDNDASTAPARKSRSKKASAEHHFWAVKACGHVFCKHCFENRRPSAKAGPMGFRVAQDGSKKIFCAVEDCDSEVSAKTAWVGIFM
ncbi:hypothetical protein F4777DRAFT_555368 [Nemania sp. FL0916]|nr:hypothetical protein F4777DRAFT_555368 [Nemania sp. FL0916]